MNEHIEWDDNTPPSICLAEPDSRMIVATYDPTSWEFTPLTQSQRWGTESLRIPMLNHSVHPGDCLVTVGPIRAIPDHQLDELDDYQGILVWHPQRVLSAQPDIDGFQEVWLARDNDVATQNRSPEDLGIHINPNQLITRLTTATERAHINWAFNLDAFCPECGNRGNPILYGMPDFAEPSYVSVGGCVLYPDAPTHTCSCGASWGRLFRQIVHGTAPLSEPVALKHPETESLIGHSHGYNAFNHREEDVELQGKDPDE